MKKGLIFLVILLCICPLAHAETSDYVRMNSGVTPEMLTAEYWLGPQDDALLMTPEQIAALPFTDVQSLLNQADTLDTAYVQKTLQALNSVPPEQCYLNGEPMPQAMQDALVKNENIEGMANPLCIRYGYTVRRDSLRRMPCRDFMGETPEDLFYDQMVQSECMPFMPVVVAHESLDGAWYFVWFYGFGGWVEKESVALCASRSDWLARQQAQPYLVVTGRELRLNIDRGCEALSGLVLPMGTRMPLLTVEQTPESVNGRVPFDTYAVSLPVRGENGLIRDEIALIPLSADVSIGDLPMTSRNVLTQAFKLLGDRYGWAGLDYANDCSGIVHEIYRCFGIDLPRTASEQSHTPNGVCQDLSQMTDVEKQAAIAALTPGSLLYFPGHIMLYAGMKDDVGYVISAVGSYAPEDMEVGSVLSVNTVTVNNLNVHRRSGQTWLTNLTAAVAFGE